MSAKEYSSDLSCGSTNDTSESKRGTCGPDNFGAKYSPSELGGFLVNQLERFIHQLKPSAPSCASKLLRQEFRLTDLMDWFMDDVFYDRIQKRQAVVVPFSPVMLKGSFLSHVEQTTGFTVPTSITMAPSQVVNLLIESRPYMNKREKMDDSRPDSSGHSSDTLSLSNFEDDFSQNTPSNMTKLLYDIGLHLAIDFCSSGHSGNAQSQSDRLLTLGGKLNPYRCSEWYCGFTSTSLFQLRDHQRHPHRKYCWNCALCRGFTAKKFIELEEHYIKAHGYTSAMIKEKPLRKHSCVGCEMDFASKNRLESHRRASCPIRNVELDCDDEMKTFCDPNSEDILTRRLWPTCVRNRPYWISSASAKHQRDALARTEKWSATKTSNRVVPPKTEHSSEAAKSDRFGFGKPAGSSVTGVDIEVENVAHNRPEIMTKTEIIKTERTHSGIDDIESSTPMENIPQKKENYEDPPKMGLAKFGQDVTDDAQLNKRNKTALQVGTNQAEKIQSKRAAAVVDRAVRHSEEYCSEMMSKLTSAAGTATSKRKSLTENDKQERRDVGLVSPKRRSLPEASKQETDSSITSCKKPRAFTAAASEQAELLAKSPAAVSTVLSPSTNSHDSKKQSSLEKFLVPKSSTNKSEKKHGPRVSKQLRSQCPYSCDICDLRFVTYAAVQKHKERHLKTAEVSLCRIDVDGPCENRPSE